MKCMAWAVMVGACPHFSTFSPKGFPVVRRPALEMMVELFLCRRLQMARSLAIRARKVSNACVLVFGLHGVVARVVPGIVCKMDLVAASKVQDSSQGPAGWQIWSVGLPPRSQSWRAVDNVPAFGLNKAVYVHIVG